MKAAKVMKMPLFLRKISLWVLLFGVLLGSTGQSAPAFCARIFLGNSMGVNAVDFLGAKLERDINDSVALIRNILGEGATVQVYEGKSKRGGKIQVIRVSVYDEKVNETSEKLGFITKDLGLENNVQPQKSNLWDISKITCVAGACSLAAAYLSAGIFYPLFDFVTSSNVPLALKVPAGLGVAATGFTTVALIGRTFVLLPLKALQSYFEYFKGSREYFDIVKVSAQLKRSITQLKKDTAGDQVSTVIFVSTAQFSYYSSDSQLFLRNANLDDTFKGLGLSAVVPGPQNEPF